MNSTFKRNLLIGFGVSLLLLIITAVASYTSIQNLKQSAYLVNHTNKVMQYLEEVISVLKDAETGQRGYLITGREEFLAPYFGARDSALKRLAEVKKFTVDNLDQQQSVTRLQDVISNRLQILESLIQQKRAGEIIQVAELEKGRAYMEQARGIIDLMKDRQQRLLDSRTTEMNKLASFTPVLIIIASLLAILITVIFFVRVNNGYTRRNELQNELLAKDEDISRRINIIKEVATGISEGDYNIRVNDEGDDGLGNLSVSLNKMAESLKYSFGLLSNKEWLQAGIAGLNDKLLGEYDMKTLSRNIMEYVAGYTESQVGAFYREEDSETLKFISGFSFSPGSIKQQIQFGEGLAGQCALTGKTVHLQQVPENLLLISHATGKIKPKNIVAIPVFYEKSIVGVIELASIDEYTENDIAFLEAISHNVGTVINSVQNRKRLQELLEETQSQAEELQAQHGELENMNSELEIQTEKLQASEEELKVQQEELVEANQELEEKARLLEEKNQLVFERNLEIQRKAEDLAASTKYKSEFLANMSHELRTPLNSILLLSRLMAENNEKNLTGEQVEYANVILNSGQGLLSLIDEILDLSKIEAGKMDLLYSDVPVQEMVNDMKALFGPIAKEKGIEFRVNVANNVPGTIETDKMRFDQVIKNLISNALKFTAKGYVLLDISMPADNAGMMAVTVKDTGIGIPEDKQHLIFEAFRQADGSTRRKYGGTGLGLSISRELAKLLAGEIKVQSEPGEGSAFTLLVPVTKATISSPETGSHAGWDDNIPVEENELQTGIAAGNEPAQRFVTDFIPADVPDDRAVINDGDKVILIVEDDTNFAKSLLEYTRQKKYKGIVTVRGDEAVKLAKQYKPVGILLDIQLPVKDGWEVMEELKSHPQTKHIPVHMMSSFDGKYRSLQKGAVDFVNKPVAFEKIQDIFSRIEYVLNANPYKVLIVEENTKHAKALAYYLETSRINAEIKNGVGESVEALKKKEVNCVILDMGVPDQKAYDMLEEVKKTPGLENLPIIIFTGKNISRSEEMRIRQYADSIVIKTAHSYQRILDEVSLFLHLVEEKKEPANSARLPKKAGALRDVLKGKTVLVADDDIRNIYSLTRSLENFEMKVLSATDGKEALKQLEANPHIDIVLMDMMMPEMNGYESTRRIKANPRFKKLPVIAVTAKAMTGDREKCIQAGASDYITKPVDIDQLLSLLRVWLYDIA